MLSREILCIRVFYAGIRYGCEKRNDKMKVVKKRKKKKTKTAMSPMLSMQESRGILNFDSSTHAKTIMIPKRQTQTLLTHARCKVLFFFCHRVYDQNYIIFIRRILFSKNLFFFLLYKKERDFLINPRQHTINNTITLLQCRI